MAEYYQSFNDFKETITNSFSASARASYYGFSASGSFSKKHQESKEKFATNKSSLLHTKLIYRSFNLYRDPSGSLEPGFIDRIEQLCFAIMQNNNTYATHYIAEMIVKDFGTHYVSTAETGAIIEQETFIDSNHAFSENTTLDSVRAAARSVEKRETNCSRHEQNFSFSTFEKKVSSFFRLCATLAAASASFGSYFGASAEGTHEVTTESKQTLSKITKHSKISTSGGPSVNSVLSFSDNGTLLIDNLVSFNHDGDWLYEIVVPRNFPLYDPVIISSAQAILKNAIELYYKMNEIRGCMDMNAQNYNFEANLDDGTCIFNNDSYPFGGVFQTCVPLTRRFFFLEDITPAWRCDHFKQDNLFIGKPACDETFFEPVKLLDETYGFEGRVVSYERETCNTFNIFDENCKHVKYDIFHHDSVRVETFWCRQKVNVTIPPEKGAMFGGLYEYGRVNQFTREVGCPGGFQPYHFGRNVTVCISYQYEQDHQYSVPIEKFFSCHSPEAEKFCSTNFTQYLIAVENNNCDIFMCIKRQTYNHQKHPIIKRPPFTLEKLANKNHSEPNIRAIYKGVQLFSVPLELFLKNDIPNGRLENGEVNISAHIDVAHKQVLLVTENLTATVEETLDNILKLKNKHSKSNITEICKPCETSDGTSNIMLLITLAAIAMAVISITSAIVIYRNRNILASDANANVPLLLDNDGNALSQHV